MLYSLERSEEEIDKLVNECHHVQNTQGTKFRGMTYEEGIINAIRWLTEQEETYPMED